MWSRNSKRKSSGGLFKENKKKKKEEFVLDPIETIIGDKKIKKIRKRGGSEKIRLMKVNQANLIVDKKGKIVKVLNVLENSANKHYIRRNVLTKGGIIEIETENKKMKAKITNRPSREGFLNVVLID